MEELFEKIKQADELCREILTLTRNTVLINMRFLDSATFRLEPAVADTTLATDGQYLYYGMKHIMSLYKADRKNVNRAYLHALFHCIMRHSFVGNIDTDVWDLACDIAVESIINDLDCEPFNTAKASTQYSVINELKRNLKSLNAERIYRYYLDRNLSKTKISQIRSYFMADNHEIWYNNSGKTGLGISGSDKQNQNGGNDQQNQNGDNDQQNQNGGSDKQNRNGDNDQQNRNAGNSQQNSRISREELEKQWKDISERVAVDMESLTRVTIPDSVRAIENSAFRGCSSLTTVTIPDSVRAIENSAFRGCTSLTTVTMPDSVRVIGGWAFSNCKSLTTVIVGYYLESGDADAEAFIKKGITRIMKFLIDEDNVGPILKLLETGKFVTAKNITTFIDYANSLQKVEIQLIFMNYSHEHFKPQKPKLKL